MSSAPDVSTNPIVVYAAIIITLLVAAVTASEQIAKIFGRLGAAWFEFAKRRREAAAERRGADYAALAAEVHRLSKQVKNMQADRVRSDAATEQQLAALRAEVVDWQAWAFEAQQAAARAGVRLPDPPTHP